MKRVEVPRQFLNDCWEKYHNHPEVGFRFVLEDVSNIDSTGKVIGTTSMRTVVYEDCTFWCEKMWYDEY